MSESSDRKAVLFDLDGTLVDTAPDFVVAVQSLLAQFDRPALAAERIAAQVSNGATALTRLAMGVDTSDPQFEDYREQLLACYAEQLGEHAKLYPGMTTLLNDLQDRDIGWGVVTNKPLRYAAPLLDALGVAKRCGALVCPEHVEQPKPHPAAIYRAVEALQSSPAAALYAGDHARDIEAGRAAGTVTVAAAYGYLPPGEKILDWRADLLAESPHQLSQQILDWCDRH